MKNTFAKYGRSIVATFFLAVMMAGPICAGGGIVISSLGGVSISSLDVNLVCLITKALFLA
jgi:hypothetical protein